MSEQSTPELAENITSLASFLSDDPETESQDEEEVSDTEPDEDTQDESEETEQDEPEDADEETPAPRTYKVTIPGEDGSGTEVEVPEDELIKGYQRQSDYTRKTQDLAHREREITQALHQKFEENRTHYLQQAEIARAAFLQVAGFKNQQEMAALAQSDPAGWVAEQQRQQILSQMLGNLEQTMQAERFQAEQQTKAEQQRKLQEAYANGWSRLEKVGIDKPTLKSMYEQAAKDYGFQFGELAEIMDARAVLLIKDAIAYRNLQSKKTEVTQKAKDSPRLPSKNSPPRNEQREKALDQKFKSGKARLNDLAAFLR